MTGECQWAEVADKAITLVVLIVQVWQTQQVANVKHVADSNRKAIKTLVKKMPVSGGEDTFVQD